MRKIIFIFIVFLFSPFAFSETLKVGIVAGPSEKLLNYISKIAIKESDLSIKPVVFTDYQFPNEALNNGDIDVNFFQTKEFLDSAILAKKYKIESVFDSFIYPMGIYSKKIKSLRNINDKAVVIIPTDASNQSRALKLLQKAELISLKKEKKSFYTIRDIVENKKNLKILTINPPQMPRYTSDADILVLNNDFVLQAGFESTDSLFDESVADSEIYSNVVAAQIDTKKMDSIKKFISIISSKEYELEVLKYYPNAIK